MTDRQALSETSNIVVAVDAEINVLERRLTKLREIRRLAVDLDGSRLPRAAQEPAKKQPKAKAKHGASQPKISPPLLVTDVIDTARDLLADGSVTIAGVHHALDRWPTARTRTVVQAALHQLGAVVVGRAQGGSDRYGLPHDTEEEEPTVATDAAEPSLTTDLTDHIRELSETAVGWTDEEYQYQLRKRRGVEVSLVEVHRARESLNGAAA